jgi:putative transposase
LTLTRVERRALLEAEQQDVSLTAQAHILSLSRSSLYYRPVPPSATELAAKHRIDELYLEFPYYGARRMAAQLQREGLSIDRKTARKYMQEMGLIAVYPGPNLSKRQPEHRIFPYLLRDVTPNAPNHVWGTDITYIRLRSGWLFLVVVLDWYSRYIVSWALDDTLELPFVLSAARQALAQATPQIWNTDQGSQFTSPQFTQLVLNAGARLSMDGKGRALDNIFTERLWRTIKYDHVYLHDYATPREARTQLSQFLRVYNERRLHEALGYRPPAEVYFATTALNNPLDLRQC